MKRVVKTGGHRINEGQAIQITLPNGKLFFDKINSPSVAIAKKRGLKCVEVYYRGACTHATINERAHRGFEIQIGDVHVKKFIKEIATTQECYDFYKKDN